MPECTVCGDDDFEEQNGHFFCTTCNTQSQDLRVLVVDEEAAAYNISMRLHEKKETKSRKNAEKYLGRPWSVYEAYEMILLHQAEALISLGAQPRIKDLVFKIWANYLYKLGVAFSDEPANINLLKYERQREMFPGTTRKPRVKNVLGKKSRKQTTSISMKKVQEQNERDMIEGEIGGQDFDKGDHPLDMTENVDNIDSDEWESEEELEDPKQWGRYRKSMNHKNVHKVKMLSLLCMCYIGLMYTNPLVTIADIIRWVKIGKIPYRDVVKLIPEDMKFFLNDWKLFQGTVPSCSVMMAQTGKLVNLLKLGLPEMPLQQLTNRYILALDLPAELHGISQNILSAIDVRRTFTPYKGQNKVMFWDGIAMATIIVSLKLILGLNDKTETQLSECTRELETACGYRGRLFVWDDWVRNKKEKLHLSTIHVGHEDNVDVENDVTVGLCRKIEPIRYSEAPSKNRIYTGAHHDAIQEPFTELTYRWKQKQLGNHDEEITFGAGASAADGKQRIGRSRPNQRTEESPRMSRNQMIKEKLIKEGLEFRHRTLQHLTHPEHFLEYLEVQNNVQSEDDGNSNDPESDIVVCSTPSKKKKSHNPSYSKVVEGLLACEEEDEDLWYTSLKNPSKSSKIVGKLSSIKQKCLLIFTFKTGSQFSSVVYSWFLGICSSMIESETALIHNEVAKIETKLFGDPAKRRNRSKHPNTRIENSPLNTQHTTSNDVDMEMS